MSKQDGACTGRGSTPRAAFVMSVGLLLSIGSARAADSYFPPPGDAWATRAPEASGIDPRKLADAVAFARANEVNWPRDVRAQIEKDTAKEPFTLHHSDVSAPGTTTTTIIDPTSNSTRSGEEPFVRHACVADDSGGVDLNVGAASSGEINRRLGSCSIVAVSNKKSGLKVLVAHDPRGQQFGTPRSGNRR